MFNVSTDIYRLEYLLTAEKGEQEAMVPSMCRFELNIIKNNLIII